MKILKFNRHIFPFIFSVIFLEMIVTSLNLNAQIWRVWLKVTPQQIYGPENAGNTKLWQTKVSQWREIEKAKLAYDDIYYTKRDFQWIRKNFVQTQMMVQERAFYDPLKNKYTVDKFLKEVTAGYGGLNSILIWPTYPNLGIDDRNQFDWIRCMPGGLNGVRDMVKQFHKHGIKVLFPYNPWDIGTRRESVSDQKAFAIILSYVGADGINGDTTPGLGVSWRTEFDKSGKNLIIEPEYETDDKYLEYDHMGWAYWDYPFIPAISRQKWIEPRHMVHVCNRWAQDHTNDLQFAFFNGVGFETWQNVWGIYNKMTPRAAETVKRITRVEESFYKLLTGPNWEPHYPMLKYGVFASKWSGPHRTLWTIVNRNDFDVEGNQMKIAYRKGIKYFDVWHGSELKPTITGKDTVLSFVMEPKGFGAILAIDNATVDENLQKLLSESKELGKIKLMDISNEWKPLPQKIVEIKPTLRAKRIPKGMIKIPGTKYVMKINGIEIEGGENPGVDVQMPGEEIARRHHRFVVDIPAFFIDKYPVTNKQFKKFIDATHYLPSDTIHFLKDWKNGTFPKGWDNKPVTWVDIEDARAYAKWAGKRLPHEWEWQYAAQGTDGRLYPWGSNWDDSAVPIPDKGHNLRGPDDVNAHPGGASPFGVEDMIGNVWQWTDEYVDKHTRAAILRGGSYYQAQGSYWYFPQAYKLNEHGKYLLMSPGQNRAGTVGFRCVKDAEVPIYRVMQTKVQH